MNFFLIHPDYDGYPFPPTTRSQTLLRDDNSLFYINLWSVPGSNLLGSEEYGGGGESRSSRLYTKFYESKVTTVTTEHAYET
jgi:hypothetical protein